MKNQQAQQPNMLAIAKRLHALGFDLIWLEPKSKKPLANDWTGKPRMTMDELRAAYRPGMNLGIRLGIRSKLDDAYCVVGVDMDVRSTDERHFREAYEAVCDLLESPELYPTVISGRGFGSKHYYVAVEIERLPNTCKFRHSAEKVFDPLKLDERTGKLGKMVNAWEVDIGSTGRQFVAPGSVHPETGGLYTEAVPLEAFIRPAPELFYEALESLPAHAVQTATVTPIAPAADVNLDALPINERVRHIIIHGDTENRWPSRSEMVQAMMVALVGAGLDDQTICTVLTCPAFRVSEKAMSERRGIRASAMEWIARQLPKARLYVERQRQESQLDVDFSEPPAYSPELAAFFREANKAAPAPAYTIVPEAPPEFEPFPVPTLNTVAAILQQEAPETCFVTGQLAAIALASAAAARRYRTEFGDPLSLYAGLITNSIGLVRHYKPALHQVFIESGFQKMIANGRFNSPAALYGKLYQSPAMLYVADDYGTQLAFAKRQPSGLLEQSLSIFADIYAAKPVLLNSAQEAGLGKRSEQVMIHHPAMTMLAMVSADQLGTIMRASELGRGALEQFLFVLAPEDPAAYQANIPAMEALPGWLTDHIKLIRREERGDDVNLIREDPEQEPDLRLVVFEAQLDAAYATLMNITDRREARPILLAARSILRRLAAILAVWHNPVRPVVSREILGWSVQYLVAHIRAFLTKFDILSTDDGRPKLIQKILECIAAAGEGGANHGYLCQYCRPYKIAPKKERDEVIEQLLIDGEIVQIPGPKKPKYISSKFVRHLDN